MCLVLVACIVVLLSCGLGSVVSGGLGRRGRAGGVGEAVGRGGGGGGGGVLGEGGGSC